ncbi:MAG TPA: LCP family protein [Acidimicrobiia bacterium]|nr:LCP family protein [Acidimicrobiia bacterium]
MGLPRTVLRAFSRRYVIALGVAVAVMVGSVVAVNYVIDTKLNNVKRVTVKTAPAPSQGANYLLLGSDTRAFVKTKQQQQAFGTPGTVNSDTMMVIHVEPGAKKTLIVSFPRDLWVNIPGMGMNKINAAFGAGPNKAIETLKADFNIDINHFISVDFQSFQAVVNAIGSVPVYFPYPARDKETGLNVVGGCLSLNGQTALQYTRSRTLEFYSSVSKQWLLADPTADIGRINRQQQFIRELAAIAVQRSLEDPLTANTIVDRVLQYLVLDQNLSKNDIFGLIDAFRTVNPNDTSHLEFQTLPWSTGPDQQGLSVLYVNQTDDQGLLARLRDFSGKSTTQPVVTVAPKDVKVRFFDGGGSSVSAASALFDLVRRGGFQSGGVGTVSSPLAQTEVRYRPGAFTQGALVLSYLQPAARLVADPTVKGADVEVVLGRDFQSIVLPQGQAAATAGPSAGAPSAGDTTAQTSNGSSLDPARFGPPVPKVAPCK